MVTFWTIPLWFYLEEPLPIPEKKRGSSQVKIIWAIPSCADDIISKGTGATLVSDFHSRVSM
jgi:hypothetical protein